MEIERSGLRPSAVLGAASEITVTDNGDGTITLSLAAGLNPFVVKGTMDCSGNPNYPAANAGHVYIVTVAGKIGGVSGVVVTAGDVAICLVDGSAAGDQAAVGANWDILEKNIDLTNINVAGITVSSLTASKPVFTDASKALSSAGTMPVDQGGTGISAYSVGDLLYASGTTTLARLAGVAAGSYLRSAGITTAPAWSTLTLPDTAAISTLLYASAANVISALPTGNSSVLVTNGSGVPSLATDIPTAVTIGGKYIYRAEGTDVPVADGGTGLSAFAVGDIVHATGTTTLAGLADVAAGSVLVSGGLNTVPAWSATPNVTSVTATTVYVNAGGALNFGAGSMTFTHNATGPTLTLAGGVLVTPSGAVGAPPLAIGAATTGLYSTGAGNLDVAIAGVRNVNVSQGVFKHLYDAGAYWTATQADGGLVTFASTSDGTAGFDFATATGVLGKIITQAGAGDITAVKMYNTIIQVTAAGTIDLPTAAPGYATLIISTTAAIVSADLETGTDVIILNGVALAAGNKATSDGTDEATLYVCCTAAGFYRAYAIQGVWSDGGV